MAVLPVARQFGLFTNKVNNVTCQGASMMISKHIRCSQLIIIKIPLPRNLKNDIFWNRFEEYLFDSRVC